MRATLPVRSTAQPPARAPTGMADQASTPAMLMTRPSRWLGTICWRRLAVLMLKKIPRPEMAAHSSTATQYQRVAANTTVSSPSITRAPRAATLNDSRRRTGPAASDSSTTLALPAAYSRATWLSLASSWRLAKTTSWAYTVAETRLMRAIMAEMLRSTGWPRT